MQKKKVLIISPHDWGHIKVSKHHYALELAQKGYEVIYLPPPDKILKNLKFKKESVAEGVTAIRHSLFFPFTLSSQLPFLFDWLMNIHAIRLKMFIGKMDIVWSFSHAFFNLKLFKGEKTIYHQVDSIQVRGYTKPAKHSDVVIGVTEQILNRFDFKNKHLIGHGLSRYFIREEYYKWEKSATINIAYCGNITAESMDRDLILSLVSNYKDVQFNFIGPYNANETHLKEFITKLKHFENAKLHGKIEPTRVAELYEKMDAFIICYNRKSQFSQNRNQSSNSHKILEYLGSGRVTISTNITAYNDKRDLIEMLTTDSNEGYKELFHEVISNLERYNSEKKLRFRIEYARSNSYANKIKEIEDLIGRN